MQLLVNEHLGKILWSLIHECYWTSKKALNDETLILTFSTLLRSIYGSAAVFQCLWNNRRFWKILLLILILPVLLMHDRCRSFWRDPASLDLCPSSFTLNRDRPKEKPKCQGLGFNGVVIDLQHHFKTYTNYQNLPKINTKIWDNVLDFGQLRAVESQPRVTNQIWNPQETYETVWR